MRITMLANRDLHSNYALNLLLPELVKKHRVRLFLSSRIGGQKNQAPELVELGSVEKARFNEVLFPNPEGAVPSGSLAGFAALGERIGHEVEILDRVNTPEGLERLRESEPDLILSIRYGSILRAEAIAVPRLGVLNLHSGHLPAYRGVMATFWALLNGESEIGTTLHFIENDTIDTGRIVGQTRLRVIPERSYWWHVLQAYPDGCRLMLKTVARIDAGETVPTHPQTGPGAYYTFPTADELQAFRQAGHRLYDPDEMTEWARRYLSSDKARAHLPSASTPGSSFE